jgi:sulfoxide reductase catalytic subunit YedY
LFQPDLITTQSPKSEEQMPSNPTTEEPTTELWSLVSANPAMVDNSNLPITPIDELHITGYTREIDVEQYRLNINGLVETEIALDYHMLLSYDTVTKVVLLICPDFFVDNAEWTGVPVTTLLAEAGIKPEASELVFDAADGYQRILPLEEIERSGVFLAHTVNGQVLPREHGFPLRLIVPGKYGSEWVKWVEHIEIK